MQVKIAVPATVANLGPGFDILALALQLQNDVHAQEVGGEDLTVDPGAEAPDDLRDSRLNLVTRAYTFACERLEVSAKGVHFRCTNRIPMARGLGSSAAAALSGVLAAVALHQAPWDEGDVLDCVAELEGHRDNAAAALLGGLAICAPGAPAVNMAVPDEIRAVLFIPATELLTKLARDVVPLQFSRDDAVFNAARCALVVRAMALKDYESLGYAMDDRWHQPARSALLPHAAALMSAAREAGASGAALAGAGPSVIALTPLDPAPIVEAMTATARAHGMPGSASVFAPRNFGTRVDVRP
jgi:homoserine kinase